KDPHDPALARMATDVFHEIRRRPYIRWIVSTHIARKQEPVAAETRVHRHILFSIWACIGHRIAHDSRAYFEFLEEFAGLRIDRLEPAVERSVEHDIPGGDESSAPGGIRLLHLPHLLPACRVPSNKSPEMAARTRVVG